LFLCLALRLAQPLGFLSRFLHVVDLPQTEGQRQHENTQLNPDTHVGSLGLKTIPAVNLH
jgi:hypothetical protein